ncbi:TPA: hypothetical protein ACVE29_000739 [Streptococcus pyogenes]|uniref:hypothetical protein n=1 Tax=Streptococcus pyogenes TaxID=1314 RepID=UPI0031F4F290
MKTKSKRFLNLATLCLALLGTALLTTQPVKAEGEEKQLPQQEYVGNGIGGDSQRNTEVSESDYDRGYEEGYKEGYEDGQKENAPASIDEKELERKPNYMLPGYSDGYFLGYYRGWDEVNRPFQTLLENIYRWLWEFFFKP